MWVPLTAEMGTSMAAILYLGTDTKTKTILDTYFKMRKDDLGEINTFTQSTDPKKFEEALVGLSFELIILEQSMLQPAPTAWITSFKAKFPHVKSKLVIMGGEAEPTKILKMIEAGFDDYMGLPPDKPILIEKVILYSTGTRSSDNKQVFSMQMSQPADLAKTGHIESLSEFDCKVRSNQASQMDEMMIIYSVAFSADIKQKFQVLARCYRSEPHPSFKGQFISYYYFVGLTPDVLTNIRNALRKSYVSSKAS